MGCSTISRGPIQLATNLEEASVVIGCSWTEAESHVMCIVNDLIGETRMSLWH